MAPPGPTHTDVRPLREHEIPVLHDDCWEPFAREMAELDAYDALAGDAAAVREANVAYRRERFDDEDSHVVVADPHDSASSDSADSGAAAAAAAAEADVAAFAGYAAAEVSESPPVFARGDALYVTELYVRPEHRGDGLAGRLLDAVEDWGVERGCEHAELHVNARNDTARAVYESRDYEVFQHKLRKSL